MITYFGVVIIMLKSRDFIYMDVIDINGKNLGYVKDILINFNKRQVTGFKVNPYKFISKGFNIIKEDIIYYNTKILVKKNTKENQLSFSQLRNMYVLDKHSNILGMVNDIIFCGKTFELKGISIKCGTFTGVFRERKILLIKDLILGEDNLLYFGEEDKFKLVVTPHKSLSKVVVNYEEN